MFERHPAVRLASVALLVGLVAPAQAATIASSSIRGESGDFFQCIATNVSTSDREVTIQVLTPNGLVLAGAGPVIVLAGRGTGVAPAAVGTIDAWCRITVKGGKSTVRGTLNLIDSNGSTLLESIVLQ